MDLFHLPGSGSHHSTAGNVPQAAASGQHGVVIHRVKRVSRVCTPLPSLHCTRCGPEEQCIFSDTCNGPNTNLFPNNITAPGCSSNNRDAPPACVAVLVCSCSSYRAFYLLHWTYRYLTEAWYQPRYIGEHALCTADCRALCKHWCTTTLCGERMQSGRTVTAPDG